MFIVLENVCYLSFLQQGMACLPLGICGLLVFVCTLVIVQSVEENWDPVSFANNNFNLDGKSQNSSRRMGKPTICIGENKGADRLRSNC